MNPLRVYGVSEQVAAHLRDGIRQGTWSEFMPGGDRLARDLGVGRNTIDAALRHLEDEGLLVPQGTGRRRRIVSQEGAAGRQLRIRILPYASEDRSNHILQDVLHRIHAAGHAAEFAGHSLMGLKMDARRVAQFVGKNPADAWLVAGGSHEVLSTFAAGPVPAFALMGRMRGVPIAGVKPDKVSAVRDAVRRLAALGHGRIIMLVSPERAHPVPGMVEQSFLDEIRSLGIPTGPYNLAVWNGDHAGFHERLGSIFRHTPPTALFLDAPELFIAAQNYFARRGILAPEHLSLVSNDPSPYFALLDPPVAHIDWTFDTVTRTVVRWLKHIACGKDDRKQTFIKAAFVEGGTIGPAAGT